MEPLQPDDPRRIGPYRVVARLGAGGMGVVYLGRSRGGRPVAVKVVHRRFVGEDRYRARFRREVGAARAVAGAFTAPVLDADPDAPTPWLATAYLPGPSLREAVAGFGPLPPDALRALAAGLAEALAAIHRAGLVHRDLKPGNVLLTAGGPRVIDFGIARPDGATAITRAGAPIGTAGYMGPEQVRGERVGPPGDVFALGATLAYAATGVEPFGTGAAHARQSRVLAGEADLGAVPGPWPRDLVAACLRPEPSARPSAAELLDALGRTGPDEPSLQGVGWLPAPVAAEVERRAAEVVPAAALAAPAAPGPRRPGRRAVIAGIGAGALTLAAASVPLVRGAADDRGAAGGGAGAAAPERPAGPPPEGAPGWRRAFTGKDLGLDVAGGLLLVNASGSTDESVDNDVRALDPRDGTVVWERTGTVARTGKDTARDDVYLTDVKGERVRAVRASSGRTRWTYDFVDDFEYFEGPGDLTASGPVVCFRISRHGRDPAEQIGALGRDDGRRRWTSEPMEDLHAVTAGGGLVVAATATSLAALDVSTGKRRWRRAMEYGDHLIAGRDTVYACDRLGTLHALRAADGGTAWTYRNAAAWTARLGGGRVYLEGADGEVLALDAATGRTAWSRRVARLEDVPRAQSTAFRLAGGILYAACSDGTLYALDAADGRVRWIYAAEEIRRGAPASVAGLVHVATADGHVRAIVPPDSPGG